MRRLATIVVFALVWVSISAVAAVGQADPEANQPDFWCEPGQGLKIEPVATPFVVPVPEEGTTWTLLVLKGGTTNETVVNPIPGQGYSHSVAANSHVILCWETAAVTTTTSSSTTTTTTSSTTTSTTQPTTTTTTTDPATTTSSSTTTTDPTTTTTTSPTTSTSEATTTTDPVTTTTVPILPVTGFDNVPLTITAAVLIVAGLAVLTGSYLYRRDDG